MLQAIDMLREISRRCGSTEPLTAPQKAWLGQGLDRFLTKQSANLQEAFGICAPQGGVPWWMEEAMRVRDKALRELAERFSNETTITSRARFVAALATRYGASSWRFDRKYDEMPTHYLGTPQQYLWKAFKSGATMPISERRLRSLLSL